MNLTLKVFFALLVFSTTAFGKDRSFLVSSPDRKIQVEVVLKNGAPFYRIFRNKQTIVGLSKLGFILKGGSALNEGFAIVNTSTSTINKSWEQPWGEVRTIQNHYNQLLINLRQQKSKLNMMLEFRVFDDGVGFRYIVPEQNGLSEIIIADELTEFAFLHDYSTWWIPAYGKEMDSEYLYANTSLNSLSEKVCTPLTMSLGDSLFVSIHEAALVDYAGMALERTSNMTLKCDLYPWSNGDKVRASKTVKTPWRTIQIGTSPGELATSYLILNLNEPNKLDDTSWIKPAKYSGIWWGMHLQNQTWEAGPKHGATTENVKALIDFASEHKISGVLAEGWNEGWEGDWTVGGNFNFTKSYPDYDLSAISRYAKEKNVALISHHETGGNIKNYEAQMEEAFKLLQNYGIHYLKTGYVNKLPSGERHQGQFMVRHYQRVVDTAAKFQVMVDMHEPVKDTGLRRTYPNLMTREGVRGTEYEAWSDGNPPSHTTILPFTRGLSGPIDYTPGIFDIEFKSNSKFRVHTTLAKQLALYVVIYSPLHMAADLPENYKGHPAFKFIEDVPTDWEQTIILNAEIGKYVTTVRQDRHSQDWYLGSITNEESRSFQIPLTFLSNGKKYKAIIYQDGKDADVISNPLPLEILAKTVDSSSTLDLHLAPGGGTAIRLICLNP